MSHVKINETNINLNLNRLLSVFGDKIISVFNIIDKEKLQQYIASSSGRDLFLYVSIFLFIVILLLIE